MPQLPKAVKDGRVRLMSDPEISIVIVNWNTRELLLQCLRSIRQRVTTTHEIVVVDNHSYDGSVEAVRREFPDVVLIVNDHNAGFAHANNQGWQKTHGRYICYLNPDTVMTNDPFPALVSELQSAGVGCVGPALVNADGSHQPSIRTFPGFVDQALILLKLRWLWRWIPRLRKYLRPIHPETPQTVDQLMGACLVLPRAVVTDGGSFDEGYWIWFEEVDLCQRLQQRGLTVRYVPAATITHYSGSSFQQHYSLAKQVWFLRSLARYTAKHWAPLPRYALLLIMPVSYVLTMLQSFFKPR